MKIKAKPTMYRGILFKSALEASYAKLFDRLKIKWEYEPKTFNMGETGYEKGLHKVYYTPDFLLEDEIYFECKGDRNSGLNERAKERFWMYYNQDETLIFGDNFYPNNQPDTVYYYKQKIEDDGYSECFDELEFGVPLYEIKFEEFLQDLKYVKENREII